MCCAVLAGSGAPGVAAEPRSVIPWLSQSIIVDTTPPPARDGPGPGASGSPTDTITVTPLGAVSREGVGLLSSDQTNFPRDLWGDTPASRVREMILADADAGVPAARALFHRILLAETDPPRGATSDASVLVARLDRLLEIGALDEAAALIERAGPDSADLFRRWFDTGLLLDRAQEPCAALRENPSLSPTLPARVFCLARGGDWNAAEITLTLGEGVGSIPPERERLLARFLDPDLFEGEPDPPVPDPLTPLDFLLREAVGLPRPPGALPLAFLNSDLGEHTPLRTRITAAERLAVSGAATPSVLFAAYRAGAPAASGGVWDRAAAVQALDAALASSRDSDVAAALTAADTRFAERGLRVALAQEYHDALADLDAAALPEAARRSLLELLLLAGDPAAAARAAGPKAGPDVLALLSVAGAGPSRAEPGSTLLQAALSGLADREPSGDREARLAAMIERGNVGEAVLDALDPVQEAGAVDPSALETALFTLSRSGLRESARAIAVQTLLLHPGG